jgi:hypothetical protein
MKTSMLQVLFKLASLTLNKVRPLLTMPGLKMESEIVHIPKVCPLSALANAIAIPHALKLMVINVQLNVDASTTLEKNANTNMLHAQTPMMILKEELTKLFKKPLVIC